MNPPSIAEITKAVAATFKVSRASMVSRKRGSIETQTARTAAIALCVDQGHDTQAIAKAFRRHRCMAYWAKDSAILRIEKGGEFPLQLREVMQKLGIYTPET